MQEPHLNHLRPTCDSRVTCPSAEISAIIFICLCIYVPLISHFHGASLLHPLQASQFHMVKMWLIQLPLPSPTWLHCSVIFFPQLDLIQGTQQEDREAYFQGILLPQQSTARRHVSLLHLCRLSSFWPTWRGLVGSILCIVVVKNLERSTLWDSKYATELSYSLSCDLDCTGNAAVTS